MTDTVTSQGEGNRHMMLFHLSEDITPTVEGESIILYRGDKKEATMNFSSSHEYNINLYYGDEDTLVKGFNAATGQPCYVIGVYFENVGELLKLQTLIELQ